MNHLALLIVNITVVLSFLSSEGSATGCDGLYEKYQSFELEDKYEAFFDQARLASEKTKELFKFLKDNKVTISSTIHLPEPTFIVSKVGRHPINQLAKIYAAEGIRVAFSPTLTVKKNIRGGYITTKKIVILESKFLERPNVRGLTITDFHELLHARIEKKYTAHLFNSVVHHMASLNTGMPAISYGSYMSMSEQLTFRQDVRLASGKLKLWCKEQSNNKLSTSNKWLEYIWPSHKPIIRENIHTIKQRIRSQLTRMQMTDNALGVLMESLRPQISLIANSQYKPPWISIRQKRLGQNRVTIAHVELSSKIFNSPLNTPPSFEFRIELSGDTTNRWPQVRDQVIKQLNDLEQRLKGSRQRIIAIEKALKAFELKWKTSKGNPKNLVAEAESLHKAAKNAHQQWLDPN